MSKSICLIEDHNSTKWFYWGLYKTDSLCGALTAGVLAINIIAWCPEPNADSAENHELIQELTDNLERIDLM